MLQTGHQVASQIHRAVGNYVAAVTTNELKASKCRRACGFDDVGNVNAYYCPGGERFPLTL